MIEKLNLVMRALIFLALATSVPAQVATGGSYTLDQAVIAAGGGQNSAGGSFLLDGTVGQTAAGTRSTASPFTVAGGFWTAQAAAPPTAALVTVSGRILTMDGGGLQNARVTLTNAGGESKTVLSGVRGAFRFTEVAAGETYIIAAASRRYVFAPQVVFIGEDLDNLIFSAVGQTGGILLQP